MAFIPGGVTVAFIPLRGNHGFHPKGETGICATINRIRNCLNGNTIRRNLFSNGNNCWTYLQRRHKYRFVFFVATSGGLYCLKSPNGRTSMYYAAVGRIVIYCATVGRIVIYCATVGRFVIYCATVGRIVIYCAPLLGGS